MKIMIGYNGGDVGKRTLSLARDYAKVNNAFVYVVFSSEGGASEKQDDVFKGREFLDFAEHFMLEAGLQCNTRQSVRGLSPGEDLIKFAQETKIDHIFLGIKKKSSVQKAILGSTARYVILNSSCPVTTVNWDLETLTTRDILKDRKILVVDDEPDIIETTKEILDMCAIDSALNFESTKKLLKANTYDLAILDIAGVKGFDLLEMAVKKNIPVLMLTAHSLTPENLKKSIEKGAASYIPKDELVNIADHAADVIRTRLKGKKYGAWFSSLKSVFDDKFGQKWKDKDRKFWDTFDDKSGQ